MATQVTTESLLASINQAVLAVEQAQETLVAQMAEYTGHKGTNATAAAKGHVLLKDAKGDEDAATGATALTPKALKTFDAANTNVIINVRDMLRLEVEAASGGRNTIIRDTHGTPHVMVVVPKFRLQDIDASLGTGVHPAFIVNGIEKSEIFIGKYQASKGVGDVPETLPRKTPYQGLLPLGAANKCRALGTGFCCVTNAMWAARALWLWKYFGGAEGDHIYFGNGAGGMTYQAEHLTGTLASDAAVLGDGNNTDCRTLTGSGPVDWNDDGTPTGICDLVGNAAEYVTGARAVAGELQVIANNNAALASCDLGENSSAWKAIMPSGALVTPGTAGTLKYTGPGAGQILLTDGESDYSANRGCALKDIEATEGTDVPAIVKALGLYPVADNVQGSVYYGGEGFDEPTFPARGGMYRSGTNRINGPFFAGFYGTRTNNTVTFRVGYVA